MSNPDDPLKSPTIDRSRRRFVRGLAAGASIYCVMPNLPMGEAVRVQTKPGMNDRYEVMDQALEIFSRTGPEYGNGLSNHGPMAAEALVAMGRTGAVIPWVEGYKKILQGPAESRNPIVNKDWREALGKIDRVGDWIAFFARELKTTSWQAVLREWVPRLAPGLVAAATHSVIRAGHAVRSIAAKPTDQRRRELAEALGYWAARYQLLPVTEQHRYQRLTPAEAIKQVQILPREQRGTGIIHEKLRRLDGFAPFGPVADLVDVSGNASRFLSDLTETFAAIYLNFAQERFTGLHAVTGPSAIRLLLPYVTTEGARQLLRFGWQAAAGLYAAFGRTPVPTELETPLPDKENLIDRAIATADEHAIKFTEVCLREYAFNPKPVYLLAAQHAVGSYR